MSNGDGSTLTTAATPISPPPLAISQQKATANPSSKSTFHLLAGLASGFTSSILLQPADLLKTRVQQSRSSSVLSTLRQITSSPQPIRQLWRGTLPSTIRTSVGSALYFTTLNNLRSYLATSPTFNSKNLTSSTTLRKAKSSTLPSLPPTLNLLSGALARASVGFVMMPISVIKVRYESSLYAYKSLLGATRSIAATDGLRGFFAGFGATALRDAPYAGLYVLFYEWGKGALATLANRVPSSDDDQRLGSGTSASINFLSGSLAAASATALTNPPDAIKTRLQLMPQKYNNTLQAARLMLREEGLRSMFDGLALRMGRKALSSALAWTVYEEVVRRAEAQWVEREASGL
ncbi:hypothetical protein FH972_022185 [Carpinus fangiana]|uniref:Mitochondrial glycine transporter n=1 Tax=Carpinus fangiana TaxID=176857 RepID=A0A5N6KTQ1_9ROSI|nr:hypothetical protein FH972_022185 [Carpinus fangiana]